MRSLCVVVAPLVIGLVVGCSSSGGNATPDHDASVSETGKTLGHHDAAAIDAKHHDASTTDARHHDAGLEASACTRVGALLDASASCRQDDQCPCGAYCSLGLCTHDCAADSDCKDKGWCDSSGRCRAATDLSVIAPVQSVTQATFAVHPTHLPVLDRTADLVVTVVAGPQSLGKMRLEPSTGLLVECGSNYASECTVTGPKASEAMAVHLKVDPAITTTSSWRLVVFNGLQAQTVTFATATPPLTVPLRSGVYTGTIWTESSVVSLLGNDASKPQPFHDTGALFSIPLEALVFGDGTLVLVDKRHVFPSAWQFQVSSTGQFNGFVGSADVSRRVLLGSPATSTSDQTDTEVSISAAGNLKMLSSTKLTGSLVTTFGGLGLGYSPANGIDERPAVTWGMSLARQSDVAAGDSPANYPTTEPPPVFPETFDRYGQYLPWDATLAGVTLSGPAVSGYFPLWSDRIEYFLCFQHTSSSLVDGGAVGPTSSVPFGKQALTPLDDYACAWPPPQPAGSIPGFPFYALPAGTVANALLASCMSDLARTAATPPATTCGANDVDCLTGDDQPSACVDAPLVLRSMGLGFEELQRMNWPDQPFYSSVSDDALKTAHRVLQQWIELHTFVAREATQANDMTFQAEPPDLASSLTASLDAWTILLHPKVTGRLMHLPTAVLAAPDYRAGQTGMSLDESQPMAVPVQMLEALTAQVQAATVLVNQTRFTILSTVPPEVPRTLRAVATIAPLARLLVQRVTAGTDAGVLPWAQYWSDAQRHLATAVTALQAEWDALERNENPLGIADSDFAIYWSGQDSSNAQTRFTEVEDYLKATGDAPGWATESVTQAAAASTAAAQAWQDVLQRQLQEQLQQQQTDDRVTQIAQNYGNQILTLCGPNLFPTPVLATDVLGALGQNPSINEYNCFLDQQSLRVPVRLVLVRGPGDHGRRGVPDVRARGPAAAVLREGAVSERLRQSVRGAGGQRHRTVRERRPAMGHRDRRPHVARVEHHKPHSDHAGPDVPSQRPRPHAGHAES